MGRVFANGPGDLGSIPGRVIPKTLKMVLDTSLLNTQQYKVGKKAGRPARTFIQQLCDDTGCNPEDLLKAMNDRETWRERVRDIRASRMS